MKALALACVTWSAAALAAPALPAECAGPPLRDVSGLSKAAAEDGALSVGLDQVATWCFDASGKWAERDVPRPPKKAATDCQKAVAACEKALAVLKKNAAVHELDLPAWADLSRPFATGRYTPKRAGPIDRPGDDVDCHSQVRAELFTRAQQRMDASRIHAQVQSEYADYKKWLYTEQLRCKSAVLEARRKGTKVVFEQVEPASSSLVTERPDAGGAATVSAAASRGATLATASPPPDGGRPSPSAASAVKLPAPASPEAAQRREALDRPLAEKWKVLAAQQAAAEKVPDYKASFLASSELKGCGCTKVNATALVRALDKKEGGEAGLALLTADDPANTRCAVCWLDALEQWRDRVGQQCAAMRSFTEYQLNKLEQSEDGPSVPQRCFDQVRSERAAAQVAAQPTDAATGGPSAGARASPPDSGTARVAVAGGTPGAPGTALWPTPGPSSVPTANSAFISEGGFTYYRPYDAGVPVATSSTSQPWSPPPATARPSAVGKGSLYDSFVPPRSYAPVIEREEGRQYVRINMSSACVAEILPGPITARNGDLIVVPLGARSVEVRSPCGGVVEIYFGQEPTPRFSEVFGRNQPVSFVFRQM